MILGALLWLSPASAGRARDRPGTAARTPPAPPTRSPAPIARMGHAVLDRALKTQAARPLPDRLDFWSAAFLGTPYYTAPEEEGERSSVTDPGPVRARDRDPEVEVRWVDCESFVEQVIALSLSRTLAEASRHLRHIRYDGDALGPTRRHFTVVKGWLARNRAAGYVRDVTRRIGGASTRTLEKDLLPTMLWRPYYLRRYFSLGVRAPMGRARIDYLPLSAIPSTGRKGLLGRLPRGALVHFVSPPHDRSPYLVTHVGFVLLTPAGPILRHASRSPHRRRVEDRPLGPYLAYAGRTPAGPEMRTAFGIHLSEVTVPPSTTDP